MNDPLIALSNAIDWKIFENEFLHSKFYSKDEKPAKPIRLMVGLLILNQLENLSIIFGLIGIAIFPAKKRDKNLS